MTIDVNKKYMLTGGQIEDLASRLALTGEEVADKAEKAQTGSTAPTTSTPGEIGQLYIQSDGTVYILKNIVEQSGQPAQYTWEEVGAGGASYTAGDGIDIANDIISATNTGKMRELTAADYNWNDATDTPTNPNRVALWKLDPGVYFWNPDIYNFPSIAASKSMVSISGANTAIVGRKSRGDDGYIPILLLNNGGVASCPTYVTTIANTGVQLCSYKVLLEANISNRLNITSGGYALDARQGKVLKDLIDAIVVPTKTSDLTNDGSDGTSTYVEANDLATVATTGAYADITGTPTNVSDFTNDAGYQTSSQVSTAIATETTARQNADVNLQGQIDAIVASSDVKDIVGTKADLNNYDTTTLGDNDIIKVLADESQSGATTYYRWSVSGATFTLIGSEGPYYTKSQTDTLVNAKADASTTYTKTEVDTALSGKANTADVPTVVQTTGTSTTDVMSQKAVTDMVAPKSSTDAIWVNNPKQGYTFPSSLSAYSVTLNASNTAGGATATSAIAINGTASGHSAISIGITSSATQRGSIALGRGASATSVGEMNIGTNDTTAGYNSSNYRLLTGLYDPQSAHDAATKGYVDTAVAGAGAATFTTNEWNALWA